MNERRSPSCSQKEKETSGKDWEKILERGKKVKEEEVEAVRQQHALWIQRKEKEEFDVMSGFMALKRVISFP